MGVQKRWRIYAVPSMDCSNVPKPVFVQTNLGTRLAVPVSPDITVKDFKRELERMHLNCFPEFGSIRINALMVKQKSCCYHLSESFPLKYAFMGSNGTWFLQIDAHPDHIESLKCNPVEVHILNSVDNVVTDSIGPEGIVLFSEKKRLKCKRNKVKIQKFPYHNTRCPGQGSLQPPLERERLCQIATRAEVSWSKKWDNNVIAEAPSETFSESVSVSGIIKKYFSDYDEVVSSSGHIPLEVCQDVWMEKLSSKASAYKLKKPEVGKRILVASDGLGLTPSNQRAALSLCRYSNGKSPFRQSASVVRNLVFEITEEG